MLCRIAGKNDEVRAFTPVVLGSSPAGAVNAGTKLEAAPSELAALQQRIAELERLRASESAQAKKNGFDEGRRAAGQEAAGEQAAALERLTQKLAEVATLRTRMQRSGEADIVKLALAIAQRILHRELATDPGAIEGLVHAALARIQNRSLTKVRVYPAGAEGVKECLVRAGAAAAVEVIADTTLRTGDVLFETSLGELDASVGTQLEEVQRGLADRLLR